MSRRPAEAAADLQCLLCGADVEPFWHPTLQETVAYELCGRCAQAFAAAADRVADRIVTPPAHNFADAHCGHPDSVGVFPEDGAVCPLCRPEVPGQLTLAQRANAAQALDNLADALDGADLDAELDAQ